MLESVGVALSLSVGLIIEGEVKVLLDKRIKI